MDVEQQVIQDQVEFVQQLESKLIINNERKLNDYERLSGFWQSFLMV